MPKRDVVVICAARARRLNLDVDSRNERTAAAAVARESLAPYRRLNSESRAYRMMLYSLLLLLLLLQGTRLLYIYVRRSMYVNNTM